MSIQLLQRAAEFQIDGYFTATHKLALMCLADSASNDTNVARPGIETMMVWTSRNRSWVSECTKDLERMGLVTKRARACRGRNAEYVVFPNGVEAVVPLAGPRPRKSAPPDPLAAPIGTGLTPDPLQAIASGEPPAIASGEQPNGSGGTSECVRWSRSNRLSPKNPTTRPTPTPTTPDGYETGPVTSRDPDDSEASIDFTVVNLVQPDPLIAGPCQECEKGWIIGIDGTPLDKCPQCHPGYAASPKVPS